MPEQNQQYEETSATSEWSDENPQPEQQDGVTPLVLVNNTNSVLINNAMAQPPLPNPAYLAGAFIREMVVPPMTVGAADTTGSTYRLCRIRSSSRISSISIINAAMAGTTAVSVGLYQINTGPVVSVALFGSAISLAAASTAVGTPVALPLAQFGQRVWEALGLAADPGVEYDIVITTTAQTGVAGTLGLKLTWCDN